MTCPYCNETLQPGAKFCVSCGRPIPQNRRPQAGVSNPAKAHQPKVIGQSRYGKCGNCGGVCRVSEHLCDRCKRKKRVWTGILIGLSAILVLGGLLAALLFLNVSDGSEAAQIAATEPVETTRMVSILPVEELV